MRPFIEEVPDLLAERADEPPSPRESRRCRPRTSLPGPPTRGVQDPQHRFDRAVAEALGLSRDYFPEFREAFVLQRMQEDATLRESALPPALQPVARPQKRIAGLLLLSIWTPRSSHLLNAKEAAELLGVPATWLLAEARRARIPHVRLGRYVRFNRETLLALGGSSRARSGLLGKACRREGRATRRRPSGTGALFVRVDSAGRETWYGKWRVGESQVKRRLGVKRAPGSSIGLTAREAEAALRRAIEATATRLPIHERLDFAEAATRYIAPHRKAC